jgi:tRNA-binding protein
MEQPLSPAEFERVDLRVGRVVEAHDFPEARIPAIRLAIDFGPELGVLRSSARITDRYAPAELVGRQVVAVVNFPPRQIGPVLSRCLVLGSLSAEGVSLLAPDHEVPPGSRIG